MSFEAMEGHRRAAADAILAKVGAGLESAEQSASSRVSDPAMKKLMAARIALEYAVLATAREKNVATDVVATALKGASVAQQTAMLKRGAAALGRAYRVEPEILANIFAARLVDVGMPALAGGTPEMGKMVDACRNLVVSIVQEQYAHRGRSDAGGASQIDSFIAPTSEGGGGAVRTELAARLAFTEASIDAAVSNGAISLIDAGVLKDRIEEQIFQPQPPQSLQFSKPFAAFFEERGKGIRIEAMTEVRGVTESLTVQEISAKLQASMSSMRRFDQPNDHRAHKPMER